MATSIQCAFCQKSGFTPPQGTAHHDCSQKAYQLLNLLATPRDADTYMNNIENLVFQGGGMKGLSYLGVLQEIIDSHPNFMKQIKRVAGTSAGAMMALYVGLNLDVEELRKLVVIPDYTPLLDSHLKLKVNTDPDATVWYSYMNPEPSIKLVVLSALKRLTVLMGLIKTDRNQVVTLLTDLMKDMLKYYAIFTDNRYGLMLASGWIAKYAIKWLFSLLAPDTESKPEESKTDDFLMMNIAQPRVDKMDVLDSAIDDALEEAMKSVTVDENKKEAKDLAEEVSEDMRTFEMTRGEGETAKKAMVGATAGKKINKEQKKHNDYYSDQLEALSKVKPDLSNPLPMDPPLKDSDLLTGKYLHYALAEMLYFFFKGTGEGHQQLGLFVADIIKQQLIEKPIQDKLAKFGIKNPNPTFAELAAMEDPKNPGTKICKDIYVTAFNANTSRTEVFSASTTPNCYVADAVRASMSIPIFFTPAVIEQKNGPPKKYYMDGGVLDNYPIWIFDDLKYCFQGNLEANWLPQHKIGIHNPKTLGFRLMGRETIDVYLKYTYDPAAMASNRGNVNNLGFEATWGYLVKSLFRGGYTEHQESVYLNGGHWPRSAYIDNLGISPVAFTLPEKEITALIQEGRNSVISYKKRVLNKFLDEGQFYPST